MGLFLGPGRTQTSLGQALQKVKLCCLRWEESRSWLMFSNSLRSLVGLEKSLMRERRDAWRDQEDVSRRGEFLQLTWRVVLGWGEQDWRGGGFGSRDRMCALWRSHPLGMTKPILFEPRSSKALEHLAAFSFCLSLVSHEEQSWHQALVRSGLCQAFWEMEKPSTRMWLFVLALWRFPAPAAIGTRADMALAQQR